MHFLVNISDCKNNSTDCNISNLKFCVFLLGPVGWVPKAELWKQSVGSSRGREKYLCRIFLDSVRKTNEGLSLSGAVTKMRKCQLANTNVQF